MSDIYESSDKIKTIQNRQLGANIFEKTLYITNLTQIGSSVYWQGFVEYDLSQLNLNTLVPEFEVTMHTEIVVDGPEPPEKIHYNTHDKLPITKPVISGSLSNFGLVQTHARAYIAYTSSGGIKSGVENGTSKLVVEYIERSFSGFGSPPRFDIKIKGSDAITA
jgi:hypothetical protein